MLYHEHGEESVKQCLTQTFGEILLESRTIPFDFSTYYDEEMGKGLLRKWLLFDNIIPQETIADIKQGTRSIEMKFSVDGKRRVNIDPGYVTLSKVVLATTKDCSHRLYLCNGIYAEITLIYYKGAWKPQKWTYPDYQSETAMEFFKSCRKAIAENTQ